MLFVLENNDNTQQLVHYMPHGKMLCVEIPKLPSEIIHQSLERCYSAEQIASIHFRVLNYLQCP